MKLGDLISLSGISVDRHYDSYHKSIFWPTWYSEEVSSFKEQVIDMASPVKPFKATDTFKIQAGYPHEVKAEQKENLTNKGIKRDNLSGKQKTPIPKLTLQSFTTTSPLSIAFTTPNDSHFIRDITIVDETSNDELAFVYVVNRKAQIITAWTEKKTNGKFILRKPYGIFKEASYVKE